MTDLDYAAEAAEAWKAVAEADGLREHERIQLEKPHVKQYEFEESTVRELMMLGANRTGKSKGLGGYIAKKLRRKGARKGWLVCPSFAMARQNMIPVLFGDPADPDVKPMIPPSEIADIVLKPDWEYIGKDGWRLTIKSDEQGAAKFAGAGLDFIAYDEPPSWPVYKEGVIRFAAGKQCEIRLAATLLPPIGQAGGICQWLWTEKIEPYLAGTAPNDLRIINVAMSDNPHITPDQLTLARRLYAPGSLDRRIRIDGEMLPGLMGARCYARFERRLHVNKFLTRAHVDPLKPLYLGCDFNVEPLCAVVMQKHGRIWRVLDEFALRPGTIPELCEQARQRYPSHRNTVTICGDATGNRRTSQTGQTDYDLLAAGLKDFFSLRFMVPDKNPPERDRVNLVNFLLGGGDSEVRLEISHECAETIADLEQVLWTRDGSGIRKAHDKNDPYYQRTHCTDGLGYVMWACEHSAIKQALRPEGVRRPIPAPSYGFTA